MTKVVFFGGYGANQTQVDTWAISAKKVNPKYDYEAIAYISKSDHDDAAIRDSGKIIEKFVAEINESTDQYVIVGHSSGCAVSNETARLVKTKNIRLIVLDGYLPNREQQLAIPTDCWYATNPPQKLMSLNAGVMKNYGVHPHEHQNLKANTLWALHYSLVNNNVPPNLTRNAFIAHGYDNCDAMLDYLP